MCSILILFWYTDRVKKIYFIRHGESEGNKGPIRQNAETPLNEKGRMQAQVVATRCKNLPIEAIVSSTMTRARETAEYILEKLPKPIQYSDLFVERRRSSEVLGKPKNDPESLRVEKIIEEHFHQPGFRHSDEETFEDLKERARKALVCLTEQKEDNILVVTHGFFLRVVVAYMLFGDGLTGETCVEIIRKLEMENTGITVFEYRENHSRSPWMLWIWNDHAHLG